MPEQHCLGLAAAEQYGANIRLRDCDLLRKRCVQIAERVTARRSSTALALLP